MVMGSSSTVGVMTGGVGKLLGAGGGSGATLPSRRVRRDCMASILLGGASWMPEMVAVSCVVVLMILSVAVISGTGRP